MNILAFNAGSRSHRAELYRLDGAPSLDRPTPVWRASDESAEGRFAKLLETYHGVSPNAVVLRFVHPGLELADRIAFDIDHETRAEIERTDLAPSHNPLALEGLDAPQHGLSLPFKSAYQDIALRPDAAALATTYPVPHEWRQRYGVRRYGFHRISHRDALERNAALCGSDDDTRSTISVHLICGCSVVAARGRTIVDSSMGMTPMEGVMMGARSGSIDPGTIFTLLPRGVMSSDELEPALSKQSGLTGVSGVSSDTREIMQAVDDGNERARFALDLYAYRLRKDR